MLSPSSCIRQFTVTKVYITTLFSDMIIISHIDQVTTASLVEFPVVNAYYIML